MLLPLDISFRSPKSIHYLLDCIIVAPNLYDSPKRRVFILYFYCCCSFNWVLKVKCIIQSKTVMTLISFCSKALKVCAIHSDNLISICLSANSREPLINVDREFYRYEWNKAQLLLTSSEQPSALKFLQRFIKLSYRLQQYY